MRIKDVTAGRGAIIILHTFLVLLLSYRVGLYLGLVLATANIAVDVASVLHCDVWLDHLVRLGWPTDILLLSGEVFRGTFLLAILLLDRVDLCQDLLELNLADRGRGGLLTALILKMPIDSRDTATCRVLGQEPARILLCHCRHETWLLKLISNRSGREGRRTAVN